VWHEKEQNRGGGIRTHNLPSHGTWYHVKR